MRNEVCLVEMEAELEPLLPGFIQNRWSDLKRLRLAIDMEDFDSLLKLGHSLLGPPGAFGFDFIVQLGREIDEAARRRDCNELSLVAAKFEQFMRSFEVRIKGTEVPLSVQSTTH